MGSVGGKEEHAAFVDGDVEEGGRWGGRGRGGGLVDDFQQHAAPVLVEPFGGGVYVVVGAGVGAADDLEEGLGF